MTKNANFDKKYHFVKIKSKNNNDSEGSWYLEADSLSVISEHFKKYVGAEIKQGMKEIISKASGKMGHLTNKFAQTVEMMMGIDPKPYFITATELENEMLRNRLKSFADDREQYLSDSLSVLLLSPNSEIIGEEYKDELVYPHESKPSLGDVKYMKWYGGKHFYAKIGKIDIVDKDNNQKWNTEDEAKEAAKWYIKNYGKN